MKITNLDLISLSETELKNIEGGSEITDAIWYGVGFVVGSWWSLSHQTMDYQHSLPANLKK